MHRHGWLMGMVAGLGLALVWSACAPVVRTFEGTGGHGGGAGGTGGTGGGAPACTPGEMVQCYDGPAGTEGVGQCASGKALCGDDGKPTGTCMGEILPATQVQCKLHQDQDCDGVPDRCTLDLIWANAYSADQGQNNAPHGVAVDRNDSSVIMAGWLDGQVDFGMGPAGPMTQGDEDVFVTKLDATGKVVWSKRYGDTARQEANAIATDAAGNVYVAGSYEGNMEIDTSLALPTSIGGWDAFLVKLDPTGAPQWQRTGGDASDQVVQAIAAAPTGGVVAAGYFEGSFAWTGGGAQLGTNANDTYAFVQRFDDKANSVFSVATSAPLNDSGPSSYHNVAAVAIDAQDDVIVAGTFQGAITFSNGQTYMSAGNDDIFVMKLAGQSGTVLWAKAFGNTGTDQVASLAIDSKGDILLTGSFAQSLTLGTSTVTTAGNVGVFLARLSTLGDVVSARGFGTSSGITRMYVAVDGADNTVLSGFFDGTIGFGGDLFSSGQQGIASYVAKLDPGGAHLGSKSFGTDGFMVFTGVAAGPKSIAVAGATLYPVDLGGGMIGQSMIADPVVATFAP